MSNYYTNNPQEIILLSKIKEELSKLNELAPGLNSGKDVFIKGIFAPSENQLQSLTIDADNAGTYTTLTQDGGSGTITFEINSTPATLPFTLSVADVLDVFRTTNTSLGHYKITGTYV